MTLIAAFRSCNGGILLCADRQEEDGLTKKEVDKIYRIPITQLQSCDVFIAASGLGGTINDTRQEIHSTFLKAKASDPHRNLFADHRELIETALHLIYERHDAQLQQTPLGLIVVVAPANNRHPLLYRTQQQLLVPETDYCADGSGKLIADYFAGYLFRSERMDKPALAALGAFILREAERYISGAGLGADMVFIHEDGPSEFHWIHNDKVKEIQEGIPGLDNAIWSYWTQHAKVPAWIDTTPVNR